MIYILVNRRSCDLVEEILDLVGDTYGAILETSHAVARWRILHHRKEVALYWIKVKTGRERCRVARFS